MNIVSTIPILGFSWSIGKAHAGIQKPPTRGLLNRKKDCPTCGPKLEKRYAKFLKEIKGDSK